ncbi:MAG: hypothetical protein KAJ63_11785, partial [Methyloprofundus sp.]|nr:hypothetical protein [Methyloprofundus sp.]
MSDNNSQSFIFFFLLEGDKKTLVCNTVLTELKSTKNQQKVLLYFMIAIFCVRSFGFFKMRIRPQHPICQPCRLSTTLILSGRHY